MTVLLIIRDCNRQCSWNNFIWMLSDLSISFVSVTDKCYQNYGFYQYYLMSNIVGFELFQLLMLLTFNLSFYCCQLWTLNLWSPTLLADVLCNSGVAGGHLVKMCGKTGDGTLWVGRWHLLHLVLLQGCANGQGVSPTGQPKESQFPWTPLFRFLIKTD